MLRADRIALIFEAFNELYPEEGMSVAICIYVEASKERTWNRRASDSKQLLLTTNELLTRSHAETDCQGQNQGIKNNTHWKGPQQIA